MSLMKDVYQAFINVGWSPNQARIMTAEVGRENDFNPKNLFGRHVDASNGKVNLGMISWQGSRGKNLDSKLRSKGLIDKSGNIVRSQASLNEMAKFLDTEIKTRPEYKRTKSTFLGNPNVAYDTAKEVVGRNLIGWDYSGSAVLGKNVNKHHAKRDKYFGQLGGKVTGGTMSAQAPSMTNAQKVKVYQAYKGNKMSAVDKAQYEADVKAGVVTMPKNGKLLTSNAPKNTVKQQAENLPLRVVSAYNDGTMDSASMAQLDADISAGIVKAPKGFKLTKPKPKGLVGRSGDTLGKAAKATSGNVLNEGLIGFAKNVDGAVDATVAVGGGLIDGIAKGYTATAKGITSEKPFWEGFKDGRESYEASGFGKATGALATPNNEMGKTYLDVISIGDDAIHTAGVNTQEATGSNKAGALVEGGLILGGALLPPYGKKGRAAPPVERPRPTLTPEEIRARVREVDNRRADGSRLGRTTEAPVPVRQPTPLDTYNNAMARSTGDLTGAASRLDGLDAQAARTSADIGNLDTTPRPDYSNARPQPAPEVVINHPDVPPVAEPVVKAPIETLLDLDGSKPQTGGVPIDVQGLRAEVLRDLGIPDEKVRQGAITGDINALETEKSLSKLDTDSGKDMRGLLEDEYSVMNEYANNIIEDGIGARAGVSPESRGQVVIDALQGYKDWYKDQVSADYIKADEAMTGKGGIKLSELEAELRRDSNWQGKAPNQSLRRGINSYLNEMGLLDRKTGEVAPMTAKQAEGLRQYINSQWSPDSAGLIARVNEKIDNGVFKSLDDNAYVDARSRYRQYKEVFENPKGIAKILDIDGINSKVSAEQIGRNLQLLAAKDGKQFKHIYDTLDAVPDAMKPQAARAKAEIQAAIAESILGKSGLKTTNKEWMQYRRPNEDGTYKAQAIFGDDVAKKLDTYIAGRNVLQHQDPNPSGTATTAKNIDAWNSPENLSGAGVGLATTAFTGGNAVLGAAAGVASKVTQGKIKSVLSERQNKRDYSQSINPERASVYRNANEKRVNNVIDSAEMQAIISEFEKVKPNETKLKVLQKKLGNSDAWKQYTKTLPPKAAKAAMSNADVLVMLTQGANSQDDKAIAPTF